MTALRRTLPKLNRRQLLVGAAVGGGLLVGWAAIPHGPAALLPPRRGETPLGPWLTIDTSGVVTVAVPQLEMGQGIGTLIAAIIAAELGADWRQMSLQPAPVSGQWPNIPLATRWGALWWPSWAGTPGPWLTRGWATRHRFMATADGTSLAAYEAPARIAAASARALLAQAAGARWGVDWRQCAVAGGMVRHGSGSGAKALPFGALAADAARFTPPDPPQLQPRPLSEPPGSEITFPRLDLPAKLDGSFPFAGDIRLPDMLYASIRHGPVAARAALAHGDDPPASATPGFSQWVRGPDWLAAVASSWWAAEQALAALAPRFTVHHGADTLAIEAALNTALHAGSATAIIQTGDAQTALGPAPIKLRYDAAAALHAPLETATATAHWRRNGWFGHQLDLWVASQAPEQTRRAVATALGIAPDDVALYPIAAGGSFDARLETPHAVEAALIARAAGKPVQLTYSRWQEQLAGVVRAPAAAELSAKVDAAGTITAWRARIATPASAREFGARTLDGASRAQAMAAAGSHADPLALEGATPPYAIADLLVEHVPVAVGLPSGRLRGNGHGTAAFFTESFIDEIASLLKREPLSFRMAMLGDDPRLAACLQRVSSLAGWNGGADASGNGLACHRIGDAASGGCIAAVATAKREGGAVRVTRIFAVADIGRVLHADIARQQLEGGLIYGIGLALGSSTGWSQGLPGNARLAALQLPVLGNCPAITLELVASDADPFDPGELGVAVAAPAIANALASATGVRYRKLPLAAEEE